MSNKPPMPSIDEMKAALQAAGYDVTRRAKYIRHTFVVEENVYKAFREAVDKQNVMVRDATTEALMLWIERHCR